MSTPVTVQQAIDTLAHRERVLETSLVSVVWGAPSIEAANTIQVAASCLDAAGVTFAIAVVDVRIVVSDGAADGEPSATATLAAAGTPVGTVLAGSGTATLTIRTDASGDFAVAVTEATPGAYRYLWLTGGGNARLWVRSSTGVLEVKFSGGSGEDYFGGDYYGADYFGADYF